MNSSLAWAIMQLRIDITPALACNTLGKM